MKRWILIFVLMSACTLFKKSDEGSAPKSELTPDQQKYKASNLETCNKGNSQGCYIVGFLTKQQGDIPEAKRYFKMACDKGHSTACNFLNILK